MNDVEPGLLEQLLDEAAMVEHCLLNTYLFAACSLKSLPEEFATLADGRENRRRAIHFERARAWKQAILGVAHEEMHHLHYVQCMLRAIGGKTYFTLPKRYTDGSWQFESWKAKIGGATAAAGGTKVPLEPFGQGAIRRFVLYEATDSLQDADPFGSANLALFDQLLDFEMDLHYERVLLDVSDQAERDQLKTKLVRLYEDLTPAEPDVLKEAVAGEPEAAGISVKQVPFQSIADLYKLAILPLYQDAFHDGTVLRTNLDLQTELANPNYAGEGFLPILPVHRDKNFDRAAAQNSQRPLTGVQTLTKIIDEIVEEGEGIRAFAKEAQRLLKQVDEMGGAREYLLALNADPTPNDLERSERLRMSHLYRFAVIMAELAREDDLSRRADAVFHPAREPIDKGLSVNLDVLTAELPAQFNAAYLVLIMWLSRIYETAHWESDRRRRMGIEMLASWPLMSLAIRPLLELVSFLPVNRRLLFRIDAPALPEIPLNARQLQILFAAEDRSQKINDRLDYYAMRALADVARWAREKLADLPEDLPVKPHVRQAISSRLAALGCLNEFEAQFPYREAGGYSDRIPDLQFQHAHPDRCKYEEQAFQQTLFEDSVVLRLRFAGRQTVQLATDPDPPSDEAGCTGTHMLHAADGSHVFDRSLFWQPSTAGIILREPCDQSPPVGVRVVAADLCVTGNGPASSGYVPVSQMSSSGAVKTTGVQQIAQINGLLDLVPLDTGDLTVSLLPRNGRRPFLNGYNHLVWRDGEPIDPFVFAVHHVDDRLVLQREIFNRGKTLLEMDPLQRLLSNRGSCGFDTDLSHIPDWVTRDWPSERRDESAKPGFAMSYLRLRAKDLAKALTASLNSHPSDRASVDTTISLAERLRDVANASPSSWTVQWLRILSNYGHTLSGNSTAGDELPTAWRDVAGLGLRLAPAGRETPNGRWFIAYTLGLMDTDALSSLVFGELYVPLALNPGPNPVVLSHDWRFHVELASVVARVAVRFDEPFLSFFTVGKGKKVRKRTLPDNTTITERLLKSSDKAYSYKSAGLADVSDWTGGWRLTKQDKSAVLTWRTSFVSDSSIAVVRLASDFAQTVEAATAALVAMFSPS